MAAVVVLGLAAAGIGARFADPDWRASVSIDSHIVRHFIDSNLQLPTIQSRLAAWETALEGFAERPVLGWGPDNFGAVFGRFATGYARTSEPHDQAHGKLVEVAATTGGLGLAAYLALWSVAFLTVWRAARGMEAGERALVLFVGAALMGGLAQLQFLFETTIGSLQTTVLLGFVVGLEARAFPDRRLPRLPARLLDAWSGLLRRRGPRVALGAAAVALAVAGLSVHQAIWGAAGKRHLATRPWDWKSTAAGIDAFRPLANGYRWWRFNAIARDWARLSSEDPARARRLFEWAERETKEGIRTEPENWRLGHSVARLLSAVASTDPAHAEAARAALERARALAPGRPVFSRPLAPPGPLRVRALGDGRHELRWRHSEGAGYHLVKESTPDRRWATIHYSWDPGKTTLILPERRGAGPYRYRVRACRFFRDCSPRAEWPPPSGEANGRSGS